MAEDFKFSEKTGFIVALFAAFIALNIYSEVLKNVKLFLGPYEYPISYLFNLMLLILFISVYFYALDYMRTGSLNEWKIFKYFKQIGNIGYAFSLIILPVILFFHVISYGINLVTNISPDVQYILTAILGFIIGVISFFIAFKSGQAITIRQRDEEVKRIQNVEEQALEQAESLFKGEFYAPALIEMGKVLELALQKRLLKVKKFDVKRFNSPQLIDFALKNQLIDQNVVSSIREIRSLRNKAAHLDIKFSKKDAQWALDETNKILEILDPKKEWP